MPGRRVEECVRDRDESFRNSFRCSEATEALMDYTVIKFAFRV